jgi:hypothetical protein
MSDFTRVATTFQLLHGRATSLRSKHGGVLRVTVGRLWITSDHTQEDYFLEVGDVFESPSGAHVVAETWNQNKEGSAVFEWLECGGIEPFTCIASVTSDQSNSEILNKPNRS